MASFIRKNIPSQNNLKEASDLLRQQLIATSDAQLSLVNRSLSQTSANLGKIQMILEDTRGNIKFLERELKSFKAHISNFDASFVPSIIIPLKKEWPSAEYPGGPKVE
ncbi:hypothetical protein G9A89_016977 [Geosiphon pyriformis]|nr:hypothetical protein G9A89_016977 [Geosiphon pyriformis]